MKAHLRSVLDSFGYVLWKRDFLRFGISPFLDVSRLNTAWNRTTDVVFDVGANVGQFAREVRHELPLASIHSFEPHPSSFEKLCEAATDSLMYRHCLALSDHSGKDVLHEYSAEGQGSHLNSLVIDARFPVRFGYSSRPVQVNTTTIDEFCSSNGIDRIDFLKIDVEGAELLVLRGAGRMFVDRKITAVYCEFNDLEPASDATGGALIPIATYLSRFGLNYACTYTDSLLCGDQLHVVANALFVLPPVALR